MSVSQNRTMCQPSFRKIRLVLISLLRVSKSLAVQNSTFFLKAFPLISFSLRPCQKELSQNIKTFVSLILKSGCPIKQGCFSYRNPSPKSNFSIAFSNLVPELLINFILLEVSCDGFLNHGFFALENSFIILHFFTLKSATSHIHD